jgi:hypothetical protein
MLQASKLNITTDVLVLVENPCKSEPLREN